MNWKARRTGEMVLVCTADRYPSPFDVIIVSNNMPGKFGGLEVGPCLLCERCSACKIMDSLR